MESKLITGYTNYKRENHPDFKGVQIIDGKNNFSISWLNQQAYCEYQLYLEHFKGIEKPQNEEFIKVKRELVAFKKTNLLNPQEEENISKLLRILVDSSNSLKSVIVLNLAGLFLYFSFLDNLQFVLLRYMLLVLIISFY